MPSITFVDHEGLARTVEAASGLSLMEVARLNDVAGIEAQCGGMCACATCHVFVDEAWLDRVGPPTDCEAPLLDFIDEIRSNSRLACQIPVGDELDGLLVVVPRSQN